MQRFCFRISFCPFLSSTSRYSPAYSNFHVSTAASARNMMQAAMEVQRGTPPLHPCRSPGRAVPSTSGACNSSTTSHSMQPFRQHRQQKMQRGARVVTHMGIRAIENFDASFEITDEARTMLQSLLESETFCQQVARETGKEGKALRFTGVLFQPVPWSVQTKKGMPAEYEPYLEDPDASIINVPPNYMFKAKVFKPSRLCAIFKVPK